MSAEFIYSNGASSLDVRSCEECGEAAHCDDLRRCACCECWSHEACSPDALEDDDGNWFDRPECLNEYRAVDDGPEPLSSTAADAFNG